MNFLRRHAGRTFVDVETLGLRSHGCRVAQFGADLVDQDDRIVAVSNASFLDQVVRQ